MSKIPQGEWKAIAARYEKGESISGIARGYGCTPPAIHYILKRHRELPAAAVRPLAPAQPPAAAAAAPIVAFAPEPTLPARTGVKFEHYAPSPVPVHASPPIAAASSPTAGKPDQRPATPPPTISARKGVCVVELMRQGYGWLSCAPAAQRRDIRLYRLREPRRCQPRDATNRQKRKLKARIAHSQRLCNQQNKRRYSHGVQ